MGTLAFAGKSARPVLATRNHERIVPSFSRRLRDFKVPSRIFVDRLDNFGLLARVNHERESGTQRASESFAPVFALAQCLRSADAGPVCF